MAQLSEKLTFQKSNYNHLDSKDRVIGRDNDEENLIEAQALAPRLLETWE